jgi:hypothetical protein
MASSNYSYVHAFFIYNTTLIHFVMHIEKAYSLNPKLDLINLATYLFSYKEEGHPPKLVDLVSCSFSYEVFNELGLPSSSLQ